MSSESTWVGMITDSMGGSVALCSGAFSNKWSLNEMR